MPETWTTGLLTAAKRLRNSRSGNPRWQLKIGGMSYTTELDSDIANRIDFGHRVPEMCTFKLNRAGRVIGYRGDKDELDTRHTASMRTEQQKRIEEIRYQLLHLDKQLPYDSTFRQDYNELNNLPLEALSNEQLRVAGSRLADLIDTVRKARRQP